MDQQIDVVIRARPLIKRESGADMLWKSDEFKISCKDKSFNFDRVFGPSYNNIDIYNEIGKPLVENVMQGINATLFAYGQTASGKTHTIIGELDELGIVPLAVKDIFAHIGESPTREFLLRASYLEIYNEDIKDLLVDGGQENLRLRNNYDNEVVIENLTEYTITSYENVMELIRSGNWNRKTGTTNLNERSSRSHCIFRLVVESRVISDDANMSENSDAGAVIVSQLNLVDLAGSERAAQTGAVGIRFKESNFINTSLMTLGLVIRKLGENEKSLHIPYRDSKLTRILQHSLGGNAKTAIICTVSPVVYDETTQTLLFAERAKMVKNKPVVNEVLSGDTMLKRQRREISDLKKKIAELESGASFVLNTEMITQKNRMSALLKQIICAGPRKKEQLITHKNRRQTCCPGEIRIREQEHMAIDEDETFDDTTINFEKLEYKFKMEELQVKNSVPELLERTIKSKENKPTSTDKKDNAEDLLMIIEDLKTQIADLSPLKDQIESIKNENKYLLSSFDKSNEKKLSLMKEMDILKNELLQHNHDKNEFQIQSTDREKYKDKLMSQFALFQQESNADEMTHLIREVLEVSKNEEFVPKKQIYQLEGEIASLMNAVETLNEEKKNLRCITDEKSADLAVSKGKNEGLSNQLMILQNEHESKSNQVDQLLHESSQFLVDKENILAELTKVSHERDGLQEKLDSVQDELVERRVRIDNYVLAISQLKNDLHSKEDTLVEKVQYISNLLSKSQEREMELNNKDTEISNLKRELDASKTSENTSSDIGTLQDVIESLGEENQILQIDLEKKIAENGSLLNAVKDLESQLNLSHGKQDELCKVSQELQLLEDTFSELDDNTNYLKSHVNELNDVRCNELARVSFIESSLSDMKEELSCKEKMLNEKERFILQLQQQIEQNQVELMQKCAEIEVMETKKETCISEVASVESSRTDMNEQLDCVNIILKEKEQQIEQFKKEIIETQDGMEVIRNEMRECREICDSEIGRMKEDLESAQSRNSELIVTLEEKSQECTELSHQFKSMTSDLQNLQCEKVELIEQLKNLQERVSSLDDETVNLLKELEAVKKYKNDLQLNLAEKADECSRLVESENVWQRKFKLSETANEELLKELDAVKKYENDLQVSLVEKNKECSNLNELEKNLRAELRLVESEKADIMKKAEDLEQEINQLTDAKCHISKELNEMKISYEHLEEKLVFEKSENEKLLKRKHDLEGLLTDMEDQCSMKSALLNESEGLASKLQKQKVENEIEITKKDVEIVEMRSELKKAEGNISDQATEIELLKSNVISKTEDINLYITRVDEQEKTIQRLKEQRNIYVKKIEKLSDDLQELKRPCGNADIKEWNFKVVALEKDNFHLSEKNSSMQNEIKELKEKEYELCCCKELLEQLNKDLKNEIAELKEKLNEERKIAEDNLVVQNELESNLSLLRKKYQYVGDGLETAYAKYKRYKQLYNESEEELDKYRKMLEEMSQVAQMSRFKNKWSVSTNVNVVNEEAPEPLKGAEIETIEKGVAKRKSADHAPESVYGKKINVEGEEGCKQQ